MKYKQERRALVDSLKNRPCHDCGGVFPLECMDFDHVLPKAKAGYGMKTMVVSWSKKRIHAEAAKCDIVCANCHRIRTQRRYLLSKAS